jgi:DNA/RNA-binding domain of Phe-tRNA-synthetase-like protein
VLCWLDVRQGDPTKLTPATRRALVLIEGISPLTAEELRSIGARVAASLLETEAASATTLLD